MEYIDWIISSVIFLGVITFVIITLPQTLNIEDKYAQEITANTLSYEIANFYDSYIIKLNSSDLENYPYRQKINTNSLISNNPLLVTDQYTYGIINNDVEIYSFDNITPINKLGVKIIEENFLTGKLNYFDVNYGQTPINVYDTIYLDENTQLISKKDLRDVVGSIDFMGSKLNIKFNYNSDNNSYYECEIDNDEQTLKLILNGSLIDSQTNDILTNNSWKTVYFGSNKLNETAFCYVDKLTSLDLNNSVIFGKIIIENTDEINISKILVFESNDLYSNSSDQTIESNNFFVEVDDSNVNVSFLKDLETDYNLSINFNESLIVPEKKEIAIIKNNTDDEKLMFFSQTKEFWVFNDSEDSLTIDIDSNLGLDLDVNFTEDLKLWLDASSLSLIDGDLVGSWTDISGNGNHATQENDGNKPVFKTNILNGRSVVRFTGDDFFSVNLNSDLTQPTTIFILLKLPENNGQIQNIFDSLGTTTRTQFNKQSSADLFRIYAGKVIDQSIPGHSNNYTITSIIYNSTNSKLRFNGNQFILGDSGTNSLGDFILGARNDGEFPLIGDISEFLIYNFSISDNNIIIIENYLSDKYGLDVETGLDFENKKIELIDLNTNRKKIIVDFFDQNTNLPIDCNYTYKNKQITINSCSNDVLIKIRYRDLEITDNTEYPKITISQKKERIIFEKNINDLNPNNYFLQIKDQKTIDLKKGKEINMDNKIYSNFFKFVDKFGKDHLVNLLIKPFNFAIDINTPDIDSGLVAYYDFKDNDSLILEDKINDNDGNIFGSNIIDFYKKDNFITNNSGYFNGSNTYVRIPTKDFNGDSGTINIWVKPIEITNETMIFGHQLVTNRLYIGFSASSILSLGVSTAASINTNAVVLENEWSNLTLTYDSGEYNFYKNGVLTKTGTYTGNIIFQGYADLGWAGNSGWTNYFNGYIGETRIYNRSLNYEEINYLFSIKEKEYN